jgi:hypothetical protein
VDAYAQVEQWRLHWIRTNQQKLRTDIWQGFVDAVTQRDMSCNEIGKAVVLPSSFSGGFRQMWQLYHDAMAIVRWSGNPDLFITMTCNPHWKEITEALLPGQTAQDRPDLVARVFNLKLEALLKDIIKRGMPVSSIQLR